MEFNKQELLAYNYFERDLLKKAEKYSKTNIFLRLYFSDSLKMFFLLFIFTFGAPTQTHDVITGYSYEYIFLFLFVIVLLGSTFAMEMNALSVINKLRKKINVADGEG